MNTALWRKCPAMSGATYGATPIVIMWTISTSRTAGPRRISASTSVSGSAQPGWMYTRMPDSTKRNASSAVRIFCEYSASHDILLSLGGRSHAFDLHLRARFLISDCSVVNRPIEEVVEQLQHFQFSKNFNRPVNFSFFLKELP